MELQLISWIFSLIWLVYKYHCLVCVEIYIVDRTNAETWVHSVIVVINSHELNIKKERKSVNWVLKLDIYNYLGALDV